MQAVVLVQSVDTFVNKIWNRHDYLSLPYVYILV